MVMVAEKIGSESSAVTAIHEGLVRDADPTAGFGAEKTAEPAADAELTEPNSMSESVNQTTRWCGRLNQA